MKRIVCLLMTILLLAIGAVNAEGIFHPPVRVDDFDHPGPGGNHSPAVAVGPDDGVLFAVWVDDRHSREDPDGNDSAIYFSRSEDGGLSWSKNVLVNNDRERTNQLYPSITYCGGVLVVAWHTLEVYAAASDDGGLSWSEAVRINPENQETQWEPFLVASEDCRFHVVWTQYLPGKGFRVHQASSLDGRSWTQAHLVSNLEVPSVSQWHPRIAVGDEENLHVVWFDNRGAERAVRSAFIPTVPPTVDTWTAVALGADIFYSSSADGGVSWSPDEKVNREIPGVSHWAPAIAVGEIKLGQGTVFVSWYDDRSGEDDPYVAWRVGDGWSQNQPITPGGTGTDDVGLNLVITNGEIVAAWIHNWYGARHLRVSKSQSGISWDSRLEEVADSGSIMNSSLTAWDGRATLVYTKYVRPSEKIFATSGQMVESARPVQEKVFLPLVVK